MVRKDLSTQPQQLYTCNVLASRKPRSGATAPTLVRSVQSRLQRLFHCWVTSFQLDRQWIVFNWHRRTRVPFPPPTYSKASLQDTAGLIPSDAFRATAHQVLVHITTHSWAHCVPPVLEHRVWQPDQSRTNVWMSRIRRGAVVVHQFGARCKPGCPVPSQRTTLLQCSERTSDRHLVRPVYSDCPLKWSYHSRPGHVGITHDFLEARLQAWRSRYVSPAMFFCSDPALFASLNR